MSTPKGSSILDQWSTEHSTTFPGKRSIMPPETDRRINALIDLIRKKDEILKEIYDNGQDYDGDKSSQAIRAINGLLLTEKLK